MADEKGPLFVNNRDSIDLDRMLNEWRGGRFGRREEEDFRRTTDDRKARVVCVLRTMDPGKQAPAMVMRREAGSTAYEVVPTGIYDDGHDKEFQIHVFYQRVQKSVYIPIDATAAEFHKLCGFGADVEVGLGSWDPGSGTEIPLYMWRVKFTNPGNAVSQSRQGSSDVPQCLVTEDAFFPSGRVIDVLNIFPARNIPIIRLDLAFGADLVWDAGQERWEITTEQPPLTGQFVTFISTGTEWTSSANYGYWAVSNLATYKTYAKQDGDEWYLVDIDGVAIPTPPDRGLIAQFIWEDDTWKLFEDSRYYKAFGVFGGMYGYGYGGWYGPYGYGWGNHWAGKIRAGAIGAANWTGQDWVLSSVDPQSYRFQFGA